jgi:phage gp37-like protein
MVPRIASSGRHQGGLRDPLGNPIRDLERYRDEWHDSFVFTFITTNDMTQAERAIWERLPAIFAVWGGRPARIRQIRVSETMRLM